MNQEHLIAEVYPIQRLPRRFSVFDYLVPDGCVVKEGDMVRMPLREREIFGVVKRVHKKRVVVERLKYLFDVVSATSISFCELGWYEWIASAAVQSAPSVLFAALPTPTKQSSAAPSEQKAAFPLRIRAMEAPLITRLLSRLNAHRRAFIHAADIAQMAATAYGFASAHPSERIAIIVPNLREAAWLSAAASVPHTLVTGEASERRLFVLWQEARSDDRRLLIGTRRAALLIPAQTDTIFVFRSGHPNHKQSDQNPRFDVRDSVWELSERTGAKLYFFDAAPRADDFDRFEKAHVCLQHPLTFRPTILDLNTERAGSPHPFISYSAAEAMTSALAAGKRVLCFYSRKGKARALRCRDCRREFPCPTCGGRFTVYETTIRCHHCHTTEPLPLSCPGCGGHNLEEEGYGNRAVQKALQTLFPQKSVSVVEQDGVEDLHADILLVTPYFFESVYDPAARPENLGLAVILDADAALYDQTFRSFEQTILRAEEIRGLAYRCQIPLLLQTYVPELFRRYYDAPEAFYLDELALRKEYQHPPYGRRVRLLWKTKDVHRSRLEHEAIAGALREMPGVRIAATRSRDPSSIIRLEFTVDREALRPVEGALRALPDHVIIDMNAST